MLKNNTVEYSVIKYIVFLSHNSDADIKNNKAKVKIKL